MQNNFYDNDSKYKNIIDILKSLPKVDTPDNFEFNLMTRIQNKSFELKTGTSGTSKYFWIFVPAAGVIVSAFVLYFAFFNDNFQQVNPFLNEPPKINRLTENTDYPKDVTDIVLDQKPLQADLSQPLTKKGNEKTNRKTNKAVRVVVKPNDVLAEEIIDLPFDKSKSVDVDKVLNKNSVKNSMSRGRLVGGTQRSRFNGFYIQDPLDQKFLEMWRAKLDSINRLMQKSINR